MVNTAEPTADPLTRISIGLDATPDFNVEDNLQFAQYHILKLNDHKEEPQQYYEFAREISRQIRLATWCMVLNIRNQADQILATITAIDQAVQSIRPEYSYDPEGTLSEIKVMQDKANSLREAHRRFTESSTLAN